MCLDWQILDTAVFVKLPKLERSYDAWHTLTFTLDTSNVAYETNENNTWSVRFRCACAQPTLSVPTHRRHVGGDVQL